MTDTRVVYALIAAGYSERTFTVEVRGIYTDRRQASAAAVSLRTSEPHLIFRTEPHVLVEPSYVKA